MVLKWLRKDVSINFVSPKTVPVIMPILERKKKKIVSDGMTR